MMGFSPLTGQLSRAPLSNEPISTSKLDQRKISYLRKFIETCLEHEVKLVIFTSPSLIVFDTHAIKNLCAQHDVPFWDYANTTNIYDLLYFRDNTHMNKLGAGKFTQDISLDLQQILYSTN
jgi:hypothetical protein